MERKSCCFTGHRSLEAEKIPLIKDKLREILTECIENGYTDFYNGGALGFDMLSAELVIEMKESYPQLKLHIIVPCEGQSRPWSKDNVTRYERILSLSDEVKCLSPHYFNGCMQIRNRYMVNNSSLCISYVCDTKGGSAGTVRYARNQGKEIINIAEAL